jgi:Type IV secretion system pilin
MAKKLSIIILLALCLWSVSSLTVSAATIDFSKGLVTCGKTGTAEEQAKDCDFAAAVNMINTLINYLIMIAMPLAAVAFAYAGWLHISAGEDTGKVDKARRIFLDVGIGVIIILSGWLVFSLIATTFLKSDYVNNTYLGNLK